MEFTLSSSVQTNIVTRLNANESPFLFYPIFLYTGHDALLSQWLLLLDVPILDCTRSHAIQDGGAWENEEDEAPEGITTVP